MWLVLCLTGGHMLNNSHDEILMNVLLGTDGAVPKLEMQ